ncbi:hypothetical protein LEP1GSC061_3887 [Leptospira wolffii serovar Khorat str. Khorat-H2]|nr:hypothetical protein LEP1GSC061_3887 [Leptospira wolffii serovar Khorat str. Khorat-H2]
MRRPPICDKFSLPQENFFEHNSPVSSTESGFQPTLFCRTLELFSGYIFEVFRTNSCLP